MSPMAGSPQRDRAQIEKEIAARAGPPGRGTEETGLQGHKAGSSETTAPQEGADVSYQDDNRRHPQRFPEVQIDYLATSRRSELLLRVERRDSMT